jgi:hypothetical protein
VPRHVRSWIVSRASQRYKSAPRLSRSGDIAREKVGTFGGSKKNRISERGFDNPRMGIRPIPIGVGGSTVRTPGVVYLARRYAPQIGRRECQRSAYIAKNYASGGLPCRGARGWHASLSLRAQSGAGIPRWLALRSSELADAALSGHCVWPASPPLLHLRFWRAVGAKPPNTHTNGSLTNAVAKLWNLYFTGCPS